MKLTTASQRILALLILLSAAICSFAYDIQEGRLYYNLNTAKQEATVTYGPTKPTGSITVPASFSYNGTRYYVTAIGDEAFKNCTELTRVDGLDQVKTIGVYAFQNCTKLTYIHLSSRLTSIGSSAFYGCNSLTEITIPDNVTNIKPSTFQECTKLAKVSICKGVTSIGFQAFYKCSSLTEITIPDNVTKIGEGAFYGCNALTSVKFGKGITSIDKLAFYNCTKLINVNIPNSVVSIGYFAFGVCTSLQTVLLPGNLTCIDKNVFGMCIGLNSQTIPSSVTSIKESPFSGCIHLNSIYCLATTPPAVENILTESNYISNITLYVPAGTVAAYKNAYGWKDFPRIEEIDPDNIMDPGYLYALLKSGSGSGLKGDVNGDNQVNISDVSALVNILLKK